MMVDGVNFPPAALAIVRPLGLSGLAISGRASPWQREHFGSRPQQIIEESWGVLLAARMNLLLRLHTSEIAPKASSPSSRKV
ncbi:MAG TPA: hypothetical protein VHP35_19465 [Terriglobia bacterium]|nr:hypothetical protein [Terriglobia bacterium]